MKYILTLLFLLLTHLLFSQQNLVPNPSFEKYTICPFDYCKLPDSWYTCSGTPEYFNACDSTNDFSVPINFMGFQNAFSGNGYCGFVAISFVSNPYYKEYLGCHLLAPLQFGHKYYITFRVCRAEVSELASNNIGLLFSTKSYQDYHPWDSIWNVPTINFAHIVDTNIITDTQHWTLIRGSIIADSAYEYILISDFFNSINTDTVLLGPNPFIQCSYYYLDNVCISEDSITCYLPTAVCENDLININIFPNPATDELTIDFALADKSYFELYDILGAKRKVISLDNGSNKIELNEFKNGLYFYCICDKTGDKIKTGKLIIQR
jgi:hypothetical protein